MRILLFLLLIPSLCFGDSELTLGGKTAAAHIIQVNGVSLRPRAYLNITGDSVTGTDSGGKTVISISGSGGGSSPGSPSGSLQYNSSGSFAGLIGSSVSNNTDISKLILGGGSSFPWSDTVATLTLKGDGSIQAYGKNFHGYQKPHTDDNEFAWIGAKGTLIAGQGGTGWDYENLGYDNAQFGFATTSTGSYNIIGGYGTSSSTSWDNTSGVNNLDDQGDGRNLTSGENNSYGPNSGWNITSGYGNYNNAKTSIVGGGGQTASGTGILMAGGAGLTDADYSTVLNNGCINHSIGGFCAGNDGLIGTDATDASLFGSGNQIANGAIAATVWGGGNIVGNKYATGTGVLTNCSGYASFCGGDGGSTSSTSDDSVSLGDQMNIDASHVFAVNLASQTPVTVNTPNTAVFYGGHLLVNTLVDDGTTIHAGGNIPGGGVIMEAFNEDDTTDGTYSQISLNVGGSTGFAFYKYGPNGYGGGQINGVGINNFDYGPITFFTNNSAHATIDRDGNILLGITSATDTSGDLNIFTDHSVTTLNNILDNSSGVATFQDINDNGLTANTPVYSNSGKQLKSGTFSGNTTKVVTTNGTLTTNHLGKFDSSGNLIDGGTIPAGTLTSITAGTGLSGGTITSSGTINSNAVEHISYQPGLLTAVNSNIGVYYKASKASTVDNITGSAVTFSCISNPTITMYECGTSTTCATPTTIGTVTVTTLATATVGTVSNAAITAGDYVGFAFTAGTCASIDISVTSQIHSN